MKKKKKVEIITKNMTVKSGHTRFFCDLEKKMTLTLFLILG